MALLEFRIFGQMLKGKTGMLVSDTIDYLDAEFDFRTDDWKNVSKWAHFSNGKDNYIVNLVDDAITKDMHLNLSEGRWEVKLHGTDPDGKTRITTNQISFCVNYFGKMLKGAPLPEIPLSVAEQIDAKAQLAVEIARGAEGSAGNAVEVALEIKRMADNGEFDGEDGAPGKTPEIQIGNIETLPPEAEATVTIGGTAERPIFNIGIPKGNTGEDGIGIEDVETEMSAEDGGFNVLTIRLTDGRSFSWMIKNGTKGETGPAGTPGLVWKGEWNEETTYTALKNGQASRDVVYYNGSAYVANHPAPITGINPEEDPSGRWALLVKQGDTGATGPEGPAGAKGDKGDKGDSGESGKDGAAGKSAYSYAVDGGYTGTEEDFAKKMAEQPGSSSSEDSENLPEVGESDNGKVLGVVGGNWEAMNLPDNSKADAVAVDFSRYESDGIIVETYADGSTLTHNFEFDAEGRPTRRTDSAGGVQTFTW